MRYKELILNRIHQLTAEKKKLLSGLRDEEYVNEVVGMLDGLEMLEYEIKNTIEKDNLLNYSYQKTNDIMENPRDLQGNPDASDGVMFGKRFVMNTMKDYIESLKYI